MMFQDYIDFNDFILKTGKNTNEAILFLLDELNKLMDTTVSVIRE